MQRFIDISLIDVLKRYFGYSDADITHIGDNEYLALCPIHKDSNPSFHMYDKTSTGEGWDWNCYSCKNGKGTGGNIITLLCMGNIAENSSKARELIEREFEGTRPPETWNVKEFAEYKGLNWEFLANTLMFESRADGIYIPYFDYDGDTKICEKVRLHPKLTGKNKKDKYRYISGSWKPFGLQFINAASKKVLYIVEGETDATTLLQAGHTALGLPSKDAWHSEYTSITSQFEKTILIMDNDDAGKMLLAAMEKDVKNLYYAKLPNRIKDINDFHMSRCFCNIEVFNQYLPTIQVLPVSPDCFITEAKAAPEILEDPIYWIPMSKCLTNPVKKGMFIDKLSSETGLKKTVITTMLEKTGLQAASDELEPWYEMSKSGILLNYEIYSDHIVKSHHILRIDSEIIMYNSDNGVYEHADEATLFTIVREGLRHEFSKEPSNIEKTMKYIVNNSHIVVNKDILDADPRIINVKNGILDITDIDAPILRKHSPEFMSMVQLNVQYIPGLPLTDAFTKYLDAKIPNAETRLLAQEVMGYCISNFFNAEKWFLMHGGGRSGKGTFLDIMQNIVGRQNCSAIKLQDLGARFKSAYMFGKRLNIGGDISNAYLSDSTCEMIKLLVGRDTIEGEFKGKDSFFFVNRARMIFACNDLPQNAGDMQNASFWEKMVLLKFDQSDPDGVLTTFKEELVKADNLNSVFIWALVGLKRLLSTDFRFTCSTESAELKEIYKRNSSSVLLFADERCEIGTPDSVYMNSDGFITDYAKWCSINTKKPKSWDKILTDLNAMYPNIGFVRKKSRINGENVWRVHGIRVSYPF